MIEDPPHEEANGNGAQADVCRSRGSSCSIVLLSMTRETFPFACAISTPCLNAEMQTWIIRSLRSPLFLT